MYEDVYDANGESERQCMDRTGFQNRVWIPSAYPPYCVAFVAQENLNV